MVIEKVKLYLLFTTIAHACLVQIPMETVLSLTMLAVAVCIPVRNRSSPKERAIHKLR